MGSRKEQTDGLTRDDYRLCQCSVQPPTAACCFARRKPRLLSSVGASIVHPPSPPAVLPDSFPGGAAPSHRIARLLLSDGRPGLWG